MTRESFVKYMDVVFAETRGKAKSMARYTEACCDCDFTDIQVKRFPEADSRYSGEYRLDWNNPDDRLFLVKDAGFYCKDAEQNLCTECCAFNFCEGRAE